MRTEDEIGSEPFAVEYGRRQVNRIKRTEARGVWMCCATQNLSVHGNEFNATLKLVEGFNEIEILIVIELSIISNAIDCSQALHTKQVAGDSMINPSEITELTFFLEKNSKQN
jgi:hypothetical protein